MPVCSIVVIICSFINESVFSVSVDTVYCMQYWAVSELLITSKYLFYLVLQLWFYGVQTLSLCFFFLLLFSEFLFLLLPVPVFSPFLNFSTICPAEFLLPTIGLSLLSALTFSSVASPFSPQHFHSTFFSPFFPQAEFQSWLSLQNKLLFVLTLQPGAVSGILCSGGQIWAAVSFSTSSTPTCYKEIAHRSPVCPILNAEFSMVMFELWGGCPNNFSSLYVHRFFNGCGKVNSISKKFHLKLW